MENETRIELRMLTELVYCERLYHFMAVQGVMVRNAEVLEGRFQHEASDRRRPRLPVVLEEDGPPWPLPKKLHFEHEGWGVVGRLDTLRGDDGAFVPVEYKRGAAPDESRYIEWRDHGLVRGAWAGDQIQLAGQMLLLQANGYPCREGWLYYRESRTQVTVKLDAGLEAAFHEARARALLLNEAPLPEPLVDSPKCIRCSLAPVCLPDETNLLKQRVKEPPRRLVPARPDGGVLYLTTPGLSLGKDGEQLVIREKGVVMGKEPLKDVIQVVCFGQGIQVSTQVLHWLLDNDRSICHLSRGGRLVGLTQSLATQNVGLRQQQFLRFSLPELRLSMARDLVVAKIKNQRTVLRRNHPGEPPLDSMAALARQARDAESLETLLGLEGEAARLYFGAFGGLLSDAWKPHWAGRNRRPPRDGVNAVLSFLYMLLARDAAVVCAQVGLDPMFGGYHTMKPGRPALALDLMEPFRPLIADSCALRVLNTGAVSPEDTLETPAGVFLSDAARRRLLDAYEQRMQELVTHPHFDYRLSYRRILELEARLLARWLEGDLQQWEPLVTR